MFFRCNIGICEHLRHKHIIKCIVYFYRLIASYKGCIVVVRMECCAEDIGRAIFKSDSMFIIDARSQSFDLS